MDRLIWLKLVFLRYYRSMGLRVLLASLLSFAATLIGPVVDTALGARFNITVDFAGVTSILTIMATTMLAVSTFSLNIMVTAHRAAADRATPRVQRILLEDTTTQSVLAVFIGAFVYSLGSLILVRLDFYPDNAALAVMLITTLVVVAVILSLLKWIDHLTTLGSLQESLDVAEHRARSALQQQARRPRFGATALSDDTVMPVDTTPLRATRSGHVQLIDMAMLQDCLPQTSRLYLDVAPGTHVLVGQTIGHVSGSVDQALLDRLGRAFTHGRTRTHEQDAEYGLITLSEIASKALSPGINDSGTAIQAVLVIKRLLWDFGRTGPDGNAPVADRVFARFPGPAELVDAAFVPILRDARGTVEVQLSLLETLTALSAAPNAALAAASRGLAEDLLAQAADSDLTERDLDRLRRVPAVT